MTVVEYIKYAAERDFPLDNVYIHHLNYQQDTWTVAGRIQTGHPVPRYFESIVREKSATDDTSMDHMDDEGLFHVNHEGIRYSIQTYIAITPYSIDVAIALENTHNPHNSNNSNNTHNPNCEMPPYLKKLALVAAAIDL